MPRAEDFLPTAQAFEVDHLLSEDVHIVPNPSPSKPPGQAYRGGYYAELSSFPSVADPPWGVRGGSWNDHANRDWRWPPCWRASGVATCARCVVPPHR